MPDSSSDGSRGGTPLPAADAARSSPARLERLVECISAAIFELAPDGCVLSANRALFAVTGYTPQQLLGQDWWTTLCPGNSGESWKRRLKAGDATDEELVLRRRDGSPVIIELSTANEYSPAGALERVVGFGIDLTPRKRLEAELIEASKLEAIGRLAGGLAHDFNNLMTSISAYAAFILEETEPGSPAAGDALGIRRTAERASHLMRQILAFSRKQMLRARPVDAASIVADIEKMLRGLLGETIRLTVSTPPAPVIAVIDPAALQQSLLYLAAHSRDAMPGGGEFSVEVDSAIVQSSEVQPAAGHPSENCVHIRVADTSPAMTDWQRRHFFEPYATLDGSARGSGLGLAAVYGFVKQSGGDLEVSCRPGHGTLLDIYLPALAGLQALDERGAVDRVRPSAAATILLVEDEPEVRNLARRILEHCGYSVLVAEGGEAALAMARQHPGPIDLLLSDVRMPDASGPGLALELASSRPEMKVLFMSGHTGANPGEPNELAGAGRLLAKPFTPEVLELQVLEVLCLSARPLPRS